MRELPDNGSKYACLSQELKRGARLLGTLHPHGEDGPIVARVRRRQRESVGVISRPSISSTAATNSASKLALLMKYEFNSGPTERILASNPEVERVRIDAEKHALELGFADVVPAAPVLEKIECEPTPSAL